MAIITEVRFAHEDGALADTLTELAALDATVVGETSTDPERGIYYFRFEYDGDGAFDAVQAALDADHTVSDTTTMWDFEDSRLCGVEFSAAATLVAPLVTEEGGFVLDARAESAPSDPRGWQERWLLPDREALHAIWQRAYEDGFEFEILDLHRRGRTDAAYPGPDALTDEQREALVAAYERGYFAEPRETSLEELGESLGLSASAIGGRINRGLKSLIGAALVQNTPGDG